MKLPPITARAADIPMGTCRDFLDYRERQVASLIEACARLERELQEIKEAAAA